MQSDDTPRTSPTLLRRTADWRDHEAWHEFVARYEPYIRRWCRELRLDHDFAEDICQQFWMDLAERMKTFRYDPGQRFRGWLLRRFRWRVVDAIRRRNREGLLVQAVGGASLVDLQDLLLEPEQPDEEVDGPHSRRVLLLELGEQVQAAVRAKVHDQTWQAFWHIAIDEWTTGETADALKMSYLAAHAARRRVSDRLAAEGNRRLSELLDSNDEPRTEKP